MAAEPRHRVGFVVPGDEEANDKRHSVWELDFFMADLCEALITNHGVHYGDYARTFASLLESLLSRSFPDPSIRHAIIKMIQALQRSESIFGRRQLHMAWAIPFHLSRICDEICKQLYNSSVGDLHLFPIEAMQSGLAVVTQERQGFFNVAVVNTNPMSTKYHPFTSDRPPKLLMQTVLEIKNVPKQRICSEAFWACDILSETADDLVVYTHILPWLNNKTHGEILEDTDMSSPATGSKAQNGNLWKTFVHAFKHVLRLQGVETGSIKAVRLLIKQRLLSMCLDDMKEMVSIQHSVRLVIRAANNNAALALARNGHELSEEDFKEMRELVDKLHTKLRDLPCPDEDTTKPPPLLDITSGWERVQRLDLHPLAETHRRIENTDDLIGQANEMPRYVPVNFLRLAASVSSFDDALNLLDDAVSLCNRIINQSVIKNPGLLICSMLTHTFIEVLPVPLGPKARAAGKACLWNPSHILYGQQLHCMQRLWQCCEFFMWSSFSIKTQKEFDAQRIIVLGVMATIGDAVIRLLAADHPSLMAVHLRGFKRKPGFAVTVGKLATQTENSVVVYPQLTLARAGVLDYHSETADEVPVGNLIWAWEDGNSICKGSTQLFRQICHAEGFRVQAAVNYLCTDSDGPFCVVTKYWEELKHHRNLFICYKWMMAAKSKLPVCNSCNSCRVAPPQISADFAHFRFVMRYMHKEIVAKAQQLRFPSFAIPSKFTAPFEAFTEDDLLHIKNLPTFDDCMGQRDSELLLSYLTAPYLRIPLILNFFATEDHVSCLGNATIRNLLEATLFEPARFLPRNLQEKIPAQVPSEDSNLLSTPYGLLFNEFQFSPEGVLKPLITLVKLAREMDAGTVYNTSVVEIILFLMRTTARVENYLAMVVAVGTAQCSSQDATAAAASVPRQLRGVHFTEAQLKQTIAAHAEIRQVMEKEMIPMLEAWNDEVMADVVRNAENSSDIDKATRISSELQAHILLILRNVEPHEWNRDKVSLLLSATMFLTTRHTFNIEALSIPETEIYDILQRHRRAVGQYLYQRTSNELGLVMDSVVRVATSTGKRTEGTNFAWGYVSGADCVGRFTRVDEDTTQRPGHNSLRPALVKSVTAGLGFASMPQPLVPCVDEGQQDVEVNLHTLSLTFKAAHLIALPSEIANQPDVVEVFGKKVGGNINMISSMQCAVMQDAVNRQWVRLVGQEHDIQFWRTADPRLPLPGDASRFFPDDLAPSEEWIQKLVEPVRRMYFTRSFWQPPIFLLLPEHHLTSDQNTCVIAAVCSKSGKKLKEIVALRDHSTVHVYDIFSLGRRWHRKLVYSTNAHFALRELEMSTGDRRAPWLPWQRHAGGDFEADESEESSVGPVILRHPTHPDNRSKSMETFLPKRILQGLLPDAILETHEFWQDPDDNIRGYPYDKEALHILWIHWKECSYDPVGGDKQICFQVYRFARAEAAPKVSELAVLKSQTITKTDETDEELERMRTCSTDNLEEQASVDEGMFRQATTVYKPNAQSATTEDYNLLLVNMLYAREGTPLYSLACVISRIELLSHVLCWTTQVDYDGAAGGAVTLDLISLPRLKLSFSAKVDSDGNMRVFSLDHAHLFLSNLRPTRINSLIQGIPHSVILSDVNNNVSILVPALHVVRPKIQTASFSTELVVNRFNRGWYTKLDTRYYLYPVHVSLSFLFTPTLASALYLLALRFLHCEYEDVFHLANSIGTDVEFTGEEEQNFNLLNFPDHRPEASACLAKVGLLVADSPVNLCWFLPEETATMIRNYNTIGLQCKLSESEERRLLYLCITLLKKLKIISQIAEGEKADMIDALVGRAIEKQAILTGSPSERRVIEDFYKKIARRTREELDIRITRDETTRLLITWHNNVRYAEFSSYYQCVLENRFAILEAEAKAIDTGVPQKATLRVPKLGKDELWNFYKDYDPLSVKIPDAQPKIVNRENRVMKLSPQFDYFYCGAQVRKSGMCDCHDCGEECGPDNGCPCAPCKQKNKEELHRLRYIPSPIPSKSSRMMSFYEIFALITTLYTQDQSVRDMTPQVKPDMRLMSPMTRRVTMRDDSNGFLQYYEMLTGTTKVRIGSGDCAKDLVLLLFPLCHEARRPESALGHLMHYLVNNPNVWSKLPKYNRTSKLSFEARMTQIYTSIMQQAGTNSRPIADPPVPRELREFTRETLVEARPETRATPFTPISTTRILPVLSNTDCSRRVWEPFDPKLLVTEGEEAVTISAEVRKSLVTQPLEAVIPASFVVFLDRSELGVSPVDSKLPFDLASHSASATTVAKSMIGRLEQDMLDFASQENQSKCPRVSSLRSEAVVSQVVHQRGPALAAVLEQLNTLQSNLVKLRDDDAKLVTHAFQVAERSVNHIRSTTHSAQHTFSARQETQLAEAVMHLRRIANQEAHIGLAYLISCIACTTAERDWIQLNPFLTPERCHAVLNLVVAALLLANRIGHLNRASESVKELVALLQKVQGLPSDDEDAVRNAREALSASILQKADSLAGILATKRVYIDPVTFAYDPRFLIFEFTWNLVLRSRQRALIEEIYTSISQNHSIVKQMIMGAGKTTVVGPILALMLADRRNLVIQVVPPALLDFTRSILRATFSCTIQKQIFCFNCDRASEVDSEVLSKFIHARQSRGIVVTTPSSIKSIFLKYIEGLDRIEDTSRAVADLDNVQREVHDLQRVLGVWKEAVLVMDEVDMLLHPLKSELNFPIGEKHQLDFAPTRWKLPIHLVDALFYYHTRRISVPLKDSPEAHLILHEIRDAIKRGVETNALQSTPHLTLLNLEFYEQFLQKKMAKWLLLFIKSHHFSGLTDEETMQYISTRPSAVDNPLLNDKVSKLETDHVKTLNLSYDWLTAFLPHVLQKIDRVTFGIMNADDMKRAREEHPKMPRSRFVTAIPFIGKDLPSQSSEFAHPDVVIGLTIMAYRYEGLRKTDFTDIMRSVHQSVEKEVGRFHQRRTNIMYNKWVLASGGRILSSFAYGEKKVKDEDEDVGMQPSESFYAAGDGDEPNSPHSAAQKGQSDVLPLKLMRQANQDETDKLYRLFRRTAEVIHWYLCEKIFPEYMMHQHRKLSASGQELGGNIMFQRRIGFSGTPSDLLPYELGKCDYEPGTDGKLLHTLTSPSIMSYHVAEVGWTVRSLLDRIATASPPFHSLIDTGALVTGMSNLQVAQYLLKHGLAQMEGVVFLDELDRKMILVRATGRVLKLAECGIPKVKRFAFYDQVHTTGMDIEHTPNAVAVQTLGKDMTFRDFSQGAYRMRGIGQGQRVHLLIIPEVYDLVQRTMKAIRRPSYSPTAVTVLQDVSAWLLVNSIRSEHTQHNQLCIQTLCNVWRKQAYEVLLAANEHGAFQRGGAFPQEVLDALGVFREPVDYTVPTFVPQPRMFSETIHSFADKNASFIRTPEGRQVVQGIMDQTKREDEIDNPVIDVQMVQEQEEEREATQEQEKQQEIEMEKFVDLAYSRDEEMFTPWALSSLKDFNRAVQFYRLEEFHLYKRKPMSFPDYLMLSRNFFNPKWSGFRRLKNVIVTMEWIPDVDAVAVLERPYKDYGDVDEDVAQEALEHTLQLVSEHQGGLDGKLVKELVQLALGGISGTAAEWTGLHEVKYAETFRRLISSNFLRDEQSGRYVVSLSLAEAETVRRVIHARKNAGLSFLDSGKTEVSLNMVPANNYRLDCTDGYREAPTPSQRDRALQCFRFFDSDLHYSDQDINFLLRSIHMTPPRQRQAFFLQLIQCRRRARQRWEKTPVSLLFGLANPYTLFHQHAMGLCLRRELAVRDIHLADAYLAFNSSHSGILSPDEVWGAMRFARLLNVTAANILDFIEVADTHHEGNIQYPDFLAMLTGSREIDDEEGGAPGKDDSTAKHLPTVPPFGGDELKDLRAAREGIRRKEEEEANLAQATEDNRVRGEIEQEQMKEELALIQTSLNPKLEDHSLHFSYQTRDPPKLSQFFGTIKPYVLDADFNTRYFRVPGDAQIKAHLRSVKLITGSTYLEEYVLSFEFCLPKVKTLQGKDYKRSMLRVLEDNGEVMKLCEFHTGAWEACPGFNSALGNTSDSEPDEEEQQYNEYGSEVYEDEDEDTSDSGDDGDGDYKLYVYSEPKDEKKLRLRRVHHGDQIVEDIGNRSNSSGVRLVEWMKVLRPCEGFVPFEVGTKRYWRPEHVELSISTGGQLLINTHFDARNHDLPATQFEEVKADADEDDKSSADSWDDWFRDFDEAYDCEEDEEEEEEEQFDMGDLTDLVAAIKKAKELRVGDKVSRNPECWEGRGNEDGGEGSVGKVTRTEENRVHVQWPNGFKNSYKWGEAGQFELIKVGSDDDDGDDWGREVANDDKWSALLKRAAGQNIRCNSCGSNCHLDSGNGWFRCNMCNNYNLCKKCFKMLEHQEHLFTDMIGLLDQMRSTDIVRGSYVRIRPEIREPAFGWQEAPKDGTPGVVQDLDEEQNTVQVMFSDETWYGKLNEVVFVDMKAEERNTVWLGIVYNNPPPGVEQKKQWRSLFAVVDQQLAPPIVEGKFKVGQRVKAHNNNRFYPGEVRAVLPNQLYAVAFDDGSFNDKVKEDQIRLNPFQKGTRVRIKSNLPSYNYTLQKGVEPGMIGEIMDIYPYSWGSELLRIRMRVRNGMRCFTQNMMDSELDLVGEAKWYTKRRPKPVKIGSAAAAAAATSSAPSSPTTAAPAPMGDPQQVAEAAQSQQQQEPPSAPPAERIPLPKSAVPTVDRAFTDGVLTTEVYLRDATYTINFEDMVIINPKTQEIIADLERDPPQQWVKQREKATFDDGRWHVLSVVVRGDQNVQAYCDGIQIQTEYNGPTLDDDESHNGDEECEEGAEDSVSSGASSADSVDGDKEPAGEAADEAEGVEADAAAVSGESPADLSPDAQFALAADLTNLYDYATGALVQARPSSPGAVLDCLIHALEQYEPALAPNDSMGTPVFSHAFPAVETTSSAAAAPGSNEDVRGSDDEVPHSDDIDDAAASAEGEGNQEGDFENADAADASDEDVRGSEPPSDHESEDDDSAAKDEQGSEDEGAQSTSCSSSANHSCDSLDEPRPARQQISKSPPQEVGAADEACASGWASGESPKPDGKVKRDVSVTLDAHPDAGNDDVSRNEDEDEDDRIIPLPRLKRHPKDVLKLDVRHSLHFLGSDTNNLTAAEKQKLGQDFPARWLAKISIHWGPDATEETVKSVFAEWDKQSRWICGGCAESNSRLHNQCVKCSKDRVEDPDGQRNKKVKVVAVMPKSKEAQDVRKKMHARLRSQYQKQLEALDANFGAMSVV